MKVATRVMVVLLVLAAAATANAATHVWFTATAASPDAEVKQQGTPGDESGGIGTALVLSCNVPASMIKDCSWTIAMAFQNGPGQPNQAGFAIDLFSNADNGKIFTLGPNPWVSVFPTNDPPAYGASPGMILRVGGADFGAGQAGGNLGSFTLRKVGTFVPPLQVDFIDAAAGPAEWGDVNGGVPDIQVGGSGVIAGGGAGGTPWGTAITIINRPEPATLSLLGMGALALIRRRR